MKSRCINIDWLEVYCLEDSIGFPHDVDFFRRCGFHVEPREYGTPVYNEMFVIYGHDNEPWFEVRRNPKSAIGKQVHGVLDPRACHVRLSNRTCYFSEPVNLLQKFLEQYGLHYQRISRIDICMDFERFDTNDLPAHVVRRYMEGRYLKIYQANVTAHGTDEWNNRCWNSLSWGNRKSMVNTKFYCKSLEIAQVKDKPYIRQAWRAAGLVDDEFTLEKTSEDGTVYKPDIWRLEFSVKSGTRSWFVIDKGLPKCKVVQSVRNTLDCYNTKQKLLDMFFSLADHYFHFKKFEADKRKDLCEDKRLFYPKEQAVFYKLENVASRSEPSAVLSRLAAKIREYQETNHKPEVYKACNVLLQDIEFQQRTASLTIPWNPSEVTAIRLLIAKRIKNHDMPLCEDIKTIQALMNLEGELFGETTTRSRK